MFFLFKEAYFYSDSLQVTSRCAIRGFFQLIALLAEFEHNIISERTKAGLEAARARGRTGGRPKLKADAVKIAIAKQLHASNSTKVKEICHTLHISKATLYRYLKM